MLVQVRLDTAPMSGLWTYEIECAEVGDKVVLPPNVHNPYEHMGTVEVLEGAYPGPHKRAHLAAAAVWE